MKTNRKTVLKFTVSLEEANKIFKALGKEPFHQVYELIGNLNEQANHQLTERSFRITRNDQVSKQKQN